jgi:hypothetical protein
VGDYSREVLSVEVPVTSTWREAQLGKLEDEPYIPDFFGRRISITGISELPGCGEAIGRDR